MKDKIFSKLKTAYSSLGLGDEILLAHAQMLASTGFVTEDNVDSIVESQKDYLSGLQKANDKRASEAAKTAKENAKKEFEEEQAKKAAEAEEAKKKAEEEAARKKAEEEAAKAAEEKAKQEAEEKRKKEEEERKKLEELKRNAEVPDYVKKMQEDYLNKLTEERKQAEEERKQFKAMLEEIRTANKEQSESLLKKLNETTEQNKQLNETISTMKAESDKLKAENDAKLRKENILAVAKELGIPQYRIDEGLPITDDMDDDAIRNKLSVIATNCKAVHQHVGSGFSFSGDKTEASKEEVDKIAAAMVR